MKSTTHAQQSSGVSKAERNAAIHSVNAYGYWVQSLYARTQHAQTHRWKTAMSLQSRSAMYTAAANPQVETPLCGGSAARNKPSSTEPVGSPVCVVQVSLRRGPGRESLHTTTDATISCTTDAAKSCNASGYTLFTHLSMM